MHDPVTQGWHLDLDWPGGPGCFVCDIVPAHRSKMLEIIKLGNPSPLEQLLQDAILLLEVFDDVQLLPIDPA